MNFIKLTIIDCTNDISNLIRLINFNITQPKIAKNWEGANSCISPQKIFLFTIAVPPARCVAEFSEQLMCHNHSSATCCECCQKNNFTQKSLPETRITPEARLVNKVCQYLSANLDTQISLRDLALKYGSNRSKLSAAFKQVHDCGVFAWLRAQRMNRAKALLLTTNLSITQVAMEVGYDNTANFSTSYRGFFNISPSEQRKK